MYSDMIDERNESGTKEMGSSIYGPKQSTASGKMYRRSHLALNFVASEHQLQLTVIAGAVTTSDLEIAFDIESGERTIFC